MGFPTTNSECSVTQQPILNFSAPAADLERSGHIFSDSVVRVRSSPLLCIWVVIVIVLGFGPDPRPGPGPGPRPGPGPWFGPVSGPGGGCFWFDCSWSWFWLKLSLCAQLGLWDNGQTASRPSVMRVRPGRRTLHRSHHLPSFPSSQNSLAQPVVLLECDGRLVVV